MRLEFWFEFASTYSYLSAMRLPERAAKAGVAVTWRPFLLGPIFAAQGMDTSPFNIYPVKGAYMWRDMERRAQAHGLTFHKPHPFPQNGLLAARTATAALAHPEGIAFCQNVYLEQFTQGADISDPDVVQSCLTRANLPVTLMQDAQSDAIKSTLRATTDAAQQRGLFGAPSFTVGSELFWGDDRLEDALSWAKTHG